MDRALEDLGGLWVGGDACEGDDVPLFEQGLGLGPGIDEAVKLGAESAGVFRDEGGGIGQAVALVDDDVFAEADGEIHLPREEFRLAAFVGFPDVPSGGAW